MGVAVELHQLHAPIDELWRRVRARDMEDPPMERDALDLAAAAFQPPDAEELSLYDPPPAPPCSSEDEQGADASTPPR